MSDYFSADALANKTILHRNLAARQIGKIASRLSLRRPLLSGLCLLVLTILCVIFCYDRPANSQTAARTPAATSYPLGSVIFSIPEGYVWSYYPQSSDDDGNAGFILRVLLPHLAPRRSKNDAAFATPGFGDVMTITVTQNLRHQSNSDILDAHLRIALGQPKPELNGYLVAPLPLLSSSLYISKASGKFFTCDEPQQGLLAGNHLGCTYIDNIQIVGKDGSHIDLRVTMFSSKRFFDRFLAYAQAAEGLLASWEQ
jgi:hypothetical protein